MPFAAVRPSCFSFLLFVFFSNVYVVCFVHHIFLYSNIFLTFIFLRDKLEMRCSVDGYPPQERGEGKPAAARASCCLERHLAGFTITCHTPRATGRFTPLPESKNTTFPSQNVWPSRAPRPLTTLATEWSVPHSLLIYQVFFSKT